MAGNEPVPAEGVMRRFASDADRKAQLRAVDAALTKLTSLGLRVSVDLHLGGTFVVLHRDNPQQSMSAMRDAWDNLASIIKRHPPGVIFAELLNEPDIEAERWQSEPEQLGQFVRKLLPRATLIVGPSNWQRADALPNVRPLSDPNVIDAIPLL